MKRKYRLFAVLFLSLGMILSACTQNQANQGGGNQELPQNIVYQPENNQQATGRHIWRTYDEANPGGQAGEAPNEELQRGPVKLVERAAVEWTNRERQRNGLQPLRLNEKACDIARLKSQDMRDKQYFSYTSPTYGTPLEMMRNFHLQFRIAAGNHAAGPETAEEVVRQWMESPEHRSHIVNPEFTEIGVGYVDGGILGSYWTQLLIDPR
ncbi:uncharacterized YkwD family protein [Bacillus oleivorans]|uniref:Uncharacterized YkwD family protein n=1 Tax=Bacillus oleivorans TaxID=1448271 RepID=A0A285CV84_9BACI|nr:CAP domain-containing protein [Bacillus oleivorans]SNX70948.1 uncharacterized YkwD family protein [Bacillus oleivorans]